MSNAKMSDVARLSGVSLTTVGRVIHNNGYVSEANRKKVEDAVKRLGYIPNTMARALKNSSSNTIGHILLFTTNMLFEQISRAVDQAARDRGYNVLSYTKYGLPGEDERIVTDFIGRRVDGVVITSIKDFDPRLIEKLEAAGIPVVRIERGPAGADRILVDDLGGTYEAVSSIARAGHERIAFIGVDWDYPIEQSRLKGYRKALSAAGLPFLEVLERKVPEYRPRCGYEAMRTLWQCEQRPTAVFAAADTLASGALQYLYEVGVHVPDDLSMMGYDNTLATLLSPPINSVGIHAWEMGREAVELLLRRKADPEGEKEEVLVRTELVDRRTVLPPPLLRNTAPQYSTGEETTERSPLHGIRIR